MQHTAASHYICNSTVRNPSEHSHGIKLASYITSRQKYAPNNNSSTAMDTSNSNTPVPISMQDKQVDVLTPCTRQHGRFVDPEGKLLQPGMVIFCEDLPFIVSCNGKIHNYIGGNMKQMYS